jgi:hypothetical protein
VGALRYYGGRRVDSLDQPQDVTNFFAQGGSALVIDEEKISHLGEAWSFRVIGRDRIRQRSMLVLGPDHD